MFGPQIFTSVIDSYLPEPHASLLNGILFGIDLKTSRVFYEKLKMVGLIHIVVLSGINITLLGSLVGSITGFFSKRASLLLTILTIILFILFVGPKAPIVRAGIMGIITLVAVIFGKKNISLYSLFLSFLMIATFYPQWIGTISLQLSYGATLGIILFGLPNSKNQIINDLKTTFAASIFTVPIIFLYFRQISFISPVSNILVGWTILPIMVLGFITALFGSINYYFGLLPSLILYGLLSYIIIVVNTLSSLPFIFFQFK